MSRVLLRLSVCFLVVLWVSSVFAAEPSSATPDHPGAAVLAQQFLPTTGFVSASPESVLDVFLQRSQQQREKLAEYSDTTVIHADLPDTSQSGEYELHRRYVAPKTLEFKPVRFTGDSFVKTNIIIRLLQSEVDHVTKEDAALTAITEKNYKFKHKYTITDAAGHMTYVYDAKPRKKRPGLFKGRMWIDVSSGALRRIDGTFAKSPSLFVKKLEFTQEYGEVDGFVLPTHLHSDSRVRIIGRAVVDIVHRDYHSGTANAPNEIAGGGTQ